MADYNNSTITNDIVMVFVVRCVCIEKGGPGGILALLAPNWSVITRPWVWLEASKFVFLSLHLGLGVIPTYASYNKYHHNIIRDCGIIVIGHFVWTILSVLFVFSLLGVADEKQLLVLKQLINRDETVGLIGRDFWLIGDTLAESSLAGMELNWLWSGLLFCLVVLVSVSTVMGCMETLGASIVDEYPSMRQYKPAIVFTIMSGVFMINLVMATKGGIHVYYLLSSYYTSWPLLFFGLLTVVAAAYSHGGKYLMKDLGEMSKMPLTHYISAHLSVLYTSIIPLLMAVSDPFNKIIEPQEIYGLILETPSTNIASITFFLLSVLGFISLVLIWRCFRTCHFTPSQLFNDIATRMGNAIGMVSNVDSHSTYRRRTIISYVWKETVWFTGYSIQNGKFKIIICKRRQAEAKTKTDKRVGFSLPPFTYYYLELTILNGIPSEPNSFFPNV
jgi:hypothetical protein